MMGLGMKKVMWGLGGLFSLLTVWCVLKIGMSVVGYWQIRTFDATVLARHLTIDWDKEDNVPEYWLRVDLKADDWVVVWEGEPGRARYPDEALDELNYWAVGSRHKVGVLRGEARRPLIYEAERRDQLTNAVAWLLASFFTMMFAGSFLAVAREDSKRFSLNIGMWMVVVGFGLFPLIGAVLFGVTHAIDIMTWQQVESKQPSGQVKFDLSQPLADVTITPWAKQKLEDLEYQLSSFGWQGKTWKAGIGRLNGMYEVTGAQRRFWIAPHDRWSTEANLGFNTDFFVPVGIMLFFGVVFAGTGLAMKGTF